MALKSQASTLPHKLARYLHRSATPICHLALLAATFSYHARLQNFTLRPIDRIAEQRMQSAGLRIALTRFKVVKRKDLEFVRLASTLTVIVVVGTFSWPALENSFWVAQVFLYGSLSFSLFSLLTSTIDNLLDFIPTTPIPTNPNTETAHPPQQQQYDHDLSEDAYAAVLSLFMSGGKRGAPRWWWWWGEHSIRQGRTEDLQISRLMVYIWQCPVMLMSWSWVFYFTGLIIFLLTPLAPSGYYPKQPVKVAIAATVMCVLPIINYFICSFTVSRALDSLRDVHDLEGVPFQGVLVPLAARQQQSQQATSTHRSEPEVLGDSVRRFVVGDLMQQQQQGGVKNGCEGNGSSRMAATTTTELRGSCDV